MFYVRCFFHSMKMVIHWFRRDLRVSDNTALNEAAKRAESVIPIFIFEDAFRTGPDVGAARLAFLLQSVESLSKNLAELGHTLIVRCGKSEDILPQLCKQVGAQAVFANKRYEPYAQRRDERITGILHAAGFGFELFKDAVVWEETEILTQAGKPYTVFTPYSKAWKAKPIPLPRGKFKTSNIQHRTTNIQCPQSGCSVLDVGCWMFLESVQRKLGHFLRRGNFAGERKQPVNATRDARRHKHRAEFQGQRRVAEEFFPLAPAAPRDNARDHRRQRQRLQRRPQWCHVQLA